MERSPIKNSNWIFGLVICGLLVLAMVLAEYSNARAQGDGEIE